MTLSTRQLDNSLRGKFSALQQEVSDLKLSLNGRHDGCICDDKGHCLYHATLAQYLHNVERNLDLAAKSVGKR